MDQSRSFPKIIAHRGFCKQHVENTIPALLAAKAVNAEMIEMDVHETGDGHFIVHHDNALSSDSPPFNHLTYRKTQQLAGHDGRAPLLSDCLKAIGLMPVDLEIKQCVSVGNFVKELDGTTLSPGSFISGFNVFLLKRLHAEGLMLPIVLNMTISIRQPMILNIMSAVLLLAPGLLPAFFDGVAADYRLAHNTFIRNLKRRSVKVFVWTVNDIKPMKKFIASRVDGIITDRPDRLFKLLNPLPG